MGGTVIGVNLRLKPICQREVFLGTKYKEELFSRTYALYKRAMLCINVNTLFQPFYKLPFLGCDTIEDGCQGHRLMGNKKPSFKR
jgi:hypothetical protein